MADGLNGGTLLGVNDLQRTIDANTKAVGELTAAVARIGSGKSTTSASSASNGATFTTGPTMGSGTPNGGGASFGGVPSSGPASGPSMPTGTSVGAMLGAAKANVNWGFTAGLSDQQMFANQVMLDTLRKQYSGGGKILGGTQYLKATGANSVGGFGAADVFGAQFSVKSQWGGSDNGRIKAQMGMAGAVSMSDPTMSMQQSQAVMSTFATMPVTNQLRMFGINTYQDGKQRSVAQIAMDVLKRTGLYGRKMSEKEIVASIRQPNSYFQANLANFGISGDMAKAVTQQAEQMVRANNQHGMSYDKYDSLMQKAHLDTNEGKDARKQLEAAGVTELNSALQTQKTSASNETEAASEGLDAFAKSLEVTTSMLNHFQDAIRGIPLVGSVMSANRGSGRLLGQAGGRLLGMATGGRLLSGLGSSLMGLVGGEGLGGSFSDQSGISTSGLGSGMGSGGYFGGSFFGGYSESAALNGSVSSYGIGAATADSGSSDAASGGASPSASGSYGTGAGGSGGGATSGSVSGSTSGNASQQGIVNAAKKYLGVKYVWGEESRERGMDCSGFVYRVLNDVGIHVPRTTAAGFSTMGSAVSGGIKNTQPGDLVFFGRGRIHHVGIYVGNNKMINSPHTGAVVRYDSIWSDYSHSRRMVTGTSSHTSTGDGHSYGSGSGSGSSNPTGNRAIGKQMMGGYGWKGNGQWQALDELWTHESGWRVNADNPTSSAYGIPQALIAGRAMPAGYFDHKTGSGASTHATGGDPRVQIRWGLNYIRDRYGSPEKAWDFWKRNHWYDKGAWEIPEDAEATVHKGEMVIPKAAAEQIRDVLQKNSGVSGGSSGGAGVTLDFKPGSIVIHLGSGASGSSGKALASEFVKELTTDSRIKALMAGDN